MELDGDVNAAQNIRARGFPTWSPRGREGHFPDATRGTNFCCGRGPWRNRRQTSQNSMPERLKVFPAYRSPL